MKLAITFKPVKPPLPIDKGNQLWEYVPTTHREGLPEDRSAQERSNSVAEI